MKEAWLVQSPGNRCLLLFMLGWGATPNAVQQLPFPEGFDVVCYYDHRTLRPLAAEDFSCYERIYLFAWSFGVWVAEQSCQGLPLHRAVAVNGTPYPASPQYGLRLKVLQRTIRSVAALGGNAFKDEAAPEKYAPSGDFEEPSPQQQVEELDFLADACQKLPEQPHLPWHRAYIATRDEIFPPARMRAYWGELGRDFESYHFPFYTPSIVLNEL
ncbi:MAG: DUF452 family protein [Akkermansiaceae bacterium]|nr:DUF452 family protein [Akkermansiaceae bacterium]